MAANMLLLRQEAVHPGMATTCSGGLLPLLQQTGPAVRPETISTTPARTGARLRSFFFSRVWGNGTDALPDSARASAACTYLSG